MSDGPRIGICSGLESQSWLGVTLVTSATGTTIHQATSATTWADLVTLQVSNSMTTDCLLYAKCETTVFDTYTIEGRKGQHTVVWYGVDGKVLKMYAEYASALSVIGNFGRLLRTS